MEAAPPYGWIVRIRAMRRYLVLSCLLSAACQGPTHEPPTKTQTAKIDTGSQETASQVNEENAFFATSRRLEAAMAGLEQRLEDRSLLRAATLGPVQHLSSGWGGVGNEKVYVGQRGFLFYRPGVDYLTGRPFLDPDVLQRRRLAGPSYDAPPKPDPRPALLDFGDQLKERGIRLLILPTPTKAQLYPDALGASGTPQNASFPEFRTTLEEAGIQVLDPLPALQKVRDEGGRPFLFTDSHWSPSGVDAVAREIAGWIEEKAPDWEQQEVVYNRSPEDLTSLGDLAVTLKMPEWSDLYPPEQTVRQRVTDSDGRPPQTENAEVLLLGDSFSNVFATPELRWGDGAGLAEQLAFHLRRPVDRLAINDGSASAVRLRLSRSPERLTGKKVVVYQIAVRELAIGNWTPLSALKGPSDGSP